VVDRLPADFVSGAVEHAVQVVTGQGKELIIVEGQGALLHHAYSTSTIGILYGAWPRFIVLTHPPLRKQRHSFPEIPVPEPDNEIKAINVLLPESKVIGLAINSEGAKNHRELCVKYENHFQLPTADVIADPEGSNKLLDAVLKALES